MIDIQQLRSNLDATIARVESRGYRFEREAFLALEADRKRIQTETEELQAKRNASAKRIGQAKSKGEDASELMAEAAGLGTRVTDLQRELESIQAKQRDFLAATPNPPHDSVPAGASAADNLEQRKWGEPRRFDFPVRDHVDLGEGLAQLDFATATKIAGSRFTLMKGDLARLQWDPLESTCRHASLSIL